MNRGDLQTLAEEKGLQGRLLRREPLRRHTSFRIGGPADFYAVVETEEHLCAWLTLARDLEEPHIILGGGTNLLVADRGVRGLVIENRCSDFIVDSESHIVHAQAGLPFALLARQTASQGSAGLEWAVGIPGTIGGAIVNNAGAYDRAMADVVHQVRILDPRGQIRNIPRDELQFGYRTSRFRKQGSGGEAILSTDFTLAPESTKVLAERIARYRALRKASQPRKPSAGSVFKNPPGLSAGQVIEQAGLKGKRIGNAQVSLKHANYIVNLGAARAGDVLELIDLIRQEIWRRFQLELELEIELVGQWENERTI